MEDMCQLTGRLTEHKYKGSYEQIDKTIRRFSAAPLLDQVNFWEQVVFSWITGNADMHLKNFSLYSETPGKHLLTPAYDMLSTALVMPEDNGKKRKIRKEDFIASMQAAGLGDRVIENIFHKFWRSQEVWFAYVDRSFLPQEMKEEFKGIIRDRISQLA